MAIPIIVPRIVRGHLFYECAGILFSSRAAAMSAASAVLEGSKPVDQYRQNIWDSFPHLQRAPAQVQP